MNTVYRAAALIALICASHARAADTPDLSGWWEIKREGLPPINQLALSPPPLHADKLAAMLATLRETLVNGTRVIDYCRVNERSGFLNGVGFEDRIEFLFTPGRITMTSDSGLLRRIYLDLPPLAAEPPPSSPGFSTGRWEGDTLVVETRHLTPTNRFPVPIPGMPAIGEGASFTEHIRLRNADTLEIRYRLTAPELLREPFEHVTLYVRKPGYLGIHLDNCPLDDRLVDAATGRTRFDLTPPADLPPP
jgi:hypothetical protein